MHLYPKNAWRIVVEDTVRFVQHSGLSICGVSFLYGLPPEQEWPFRGGDPTFSPTNTSEHGRSKPHTELQTLAALYQWCGTHPQAVVAYTHDKGTRRGPEDVTLFFSPMGLVAVPRVIHPGSPLGLLGSAEQRRLRYLRRQQKVDAGAALFWQLLVGHVSPR